MQGIAAIRVDQSQKKFPSGNLKRVSSDDVKRLILLTEARIRCADYMVLSRDPEILIKYLSELRDYDLAIDLAVAHNTLVSYPVALMLKDYQLMISGHPNEKEAVLKNDLSQWQI
jgi:hypothetical protein